MPVLTIKTDEMLKQVSWERGRPEGLFDIARRAG
jgi:hypothetical protein